MDELAKRATESAEFVRSAARAEFEAQQLIASGNLEDARARRDAILIQRQSLEAQRAALRESLAELQNGTIDTTGLKDLPILGGAFAALNRSAVELQEQITAVDEELTGTQNEFYALNTALNSSTAAAQVAGDAFLALRTQELDLANQRGASLSALSALVDQESRLTDSFIEGQQERVAAVELASARSAEERAVRESRAAEDLDRDLQRQAQMHAARMESIVEASQGRIESLRASVIDAEEQYHVDSAAALKSFLRTKREIERDGERSEREAIEANQIDDILRIREDTEDLLRKNRQGFNDQGETRSAELAAFKANVEQRIAAENTALIASLQSTQKEYENRLALDAETRQIANEREQADRDLRARWAAEDAAAYETKAKERFDAEIARLNDLQTAEQTRIDAAKTALTELQTAEAITSAARLDNERLFQEGVYRTTTALERMNSMLAGFGLIEAPLIGPAAPGAPGGPSAPGVLGLPPPPIDPFGFGNFFNGASSSSPPGREGTQGTGLTIVLEPGAVVVGDIQLY